nr:MAG: putative RNA-dependent RNA polymerase [Mitoviridae sp.]
MKTRIPILNEYIEPRKASRLNIENLYATILHLIQLIDPVNAGLITGFIGQIYNRALFIYGLDPVEFIRLIKAVRKWYIEHLRGVNAGWDSKDMMNWDSELKCPELLAGIHELEKRLAQVNRPQEILLFHRLLYTLLCMDRVVIIPAKPDFTSITAKFAGNFESDDYPSSIDITLALSALGITKAEFSKDFRQACKYFQYELLSTKGPNGVQTWTAHLDAKAWSTRPKTFTQFRSWLDHSSLANIYKDILGCIRIESKEISPLGSPSLGKLAVIEEWGGKTRIVAELDYWTQMALTPLHNTINHFLKGIAQDGTFDQKKIGTVVLEWTKDPKRVINSFDLSNATDRLPVQLQEDILAAVLPAADMGSNWRKLLTMRPFLTPNGDNIFYEVGQPMGARSSFPMLALTHHVIVQIAAKRAGLDKFNDYVILGDDIVICNDLVSTKYRAIMACLGVAINESKSVLHRKGSLPAAEVCKRVFVNGNEISMFNAKEIVKTIKDGRLAPTLQNDLLNSGWEPSEQVFWTFMAAILDKDNLIALIKLNLVPTEISGLSKVVTPATDMTNLNNWYEGIALTNNDLVELHTYVIATDQLKRLDTVLRAGSSLTDALGIMAASNANPGAVPKTVRDTWLNSTLDPAELKKFTELIDGMEDFNYSHPVLKAARAETNRISELLHSLNSFDVKMVTSARNGLLEACRSAIGSVWTFGERPPLQEMRALFLRVLSTLNTIVVKARRAEDPATALSITYSVTLTSIGRLWNVFFKIGGRTSVNALRASVARNTIEAAATLTGALDKIVFDTPMVDSPKEGQKTITGANEVVDATPIERENTPTQGTL